MHQCTVPAVPDDGWLAGRTLPHFFGIRLGNVVEIRGADAGHLARSRRARPGETVAVIDPSGLLLTVVIESVAPELVVGRIVSEVEHRSEPRARITLALAMLPAAVLDPALARATECGAAGFVLVAAERSVARGAKPERWATICRESAMLAGRLVIPRLRGPMPFAQAWAEAESPHLLDPRAPKRLAALEVPADVTLFIGPEGGWSQAEVAIACERRLSLGPRNLRSETAALTALAVALAARGDI